ncbi:hypothetical protein [Rhodanobacter aciditrophus]|uniref:hypothetical protein n=1 Tax=Rhodanobacter aciditrophus TaxID=1623218 RepID=UPI003CECACA1
MNKPQAAIAYIPASKPFFKLDEAAKLLALARFPHVEDGVDFDALDQAMLRAYADEQFIGALKDAIRTGSITARDPVTNLAVSATDIRLQVSAEQLLLSRDDLMSFARGALLVVVEEDGDQQATISPSGTDDRLPETSESTGVRPGRKRVDAIGREILEAIAEIQNSDTRTIVDVHSVMLKLMARAGKEGSCVIAADRSEFSVTWQKLGSSPRTLDRELLRKRLGNFEGA